MLFHVFGLIILTCIAIAVAVVSVLTLSRQEKRSRARVVERWSALVNESDLETPQKNWILQNYIPKLAKTSHRSIYYGAQFSLMAKTIVVLPVIGSVIALLAVATPWVVYGMVSLTVIVGLVQIATAFQDIDRNGDQWRDYRRIAFQLEETLNELLLPTPHIPLAEQFDQFYQEYRKILNLEATLFDRRAESAMTAVEQQAQAAVAQLQQTRDNYHSKYGGNGHDTNDRNQRANDWGGIDGITPMDDLGMGDDGSGSMDRSGTSVTPEYLAHRKAVETRSGLGMPLKPELKPWVEWSQGKRRLGNLEIGVSQESIQKTIQEGRAIGVAMAQQIDEDVTGLAALEEDEPISEAW